MSSNRIHRIVAVCVTTVAFIVSLAFWLAGGDDRNTDYLFWTLFSLAGAIIAGMALGADFRREPLAIDWALWALPLPYLVAGLMSALV